MCVIGINVFPDNRCYFKYDAAETPTCLHEAYRRGGGRSAQVKVIPRLRFIGYETAGLNIPLFPFLLLVTFSYNSKTPTACHLKISAILYIASFHS